MEKENINNKVIHTMYIIVMDKGKEKDYKYLKIVVKDLEENF